MPVAERRTALAEAAVRVIARDGVAAASVRAIAAEAGMALASVHYAYASREELLREAIRVVVEGEREATQGFPDARHDGGERDVETLLRGSLAAYVGLLRADPGREQGMLELTHHALRTPELAGVAHEQYQAYYGLVGELLVAAAERCGVEWVTPVPVLARLIVTVTDGLTVQWLVDPDPAAVDTQIALVAAAVAREAVAR